MNNFSLVAEIQLQMGPQAENVLRKIRGNIEQSLNFTTGGASTAFDNIGRSAQKASSNANLFNSTLAQVRENLAKNTAVTKHATGSLEEFARMSGLAIRRYSGFVITTSAVFGLLRAMGGAIKDAINFEKQMIRVAQTSEKSLQGVAHVGKEISRIAKQWGVDSKELAGVAVTLAQAGYSASETQSMLEELGKTTLAATFGNISKTTEGLIAMLNQFNLSVSETGRILSMVNTVAAKYAVESDDIIEGVKRAGAAFASSGGDIAEFMALFTAVRQTTREGAETIATGMRTIFTRIQRGSTISMLEELGAKLRDVNGQFVGPMNAIRELNRVMSQIPTTSGLYTAVVEEVGGYRQISKTIPLIQQLSLAEQVLNDARSATNSLTKDATLAQEALWVQIKKVKEEFLDLFRGITQSVAFKLLLSTVLELTSAIIKMAESIRPILPILVGMAALRAGLFLRQRGANLGREFVSPWVGKSSGGMINAGGGGIDDVPAMLTKGEYVLRRSAVSAIGVGTLDKINKFAAGGIVGGNRHFYGGPEQPVSHTNPLLKAITASQGVAPDLKSLVAESVVGIESTVAEIVRRDVDKAQAGSQQVTSKSPISESVKSVNPAVEKLLAEPIHSSGQLLDQQLRNQKNAVQLAEDYAKVQRARYRAMARQQGWRGNQALNRQLIADTMRDTSFYNIDEISQRGLGPRDDPQMHPDIARNPMQSRYYRFGRLVGRGMAAEGRVWKQQPLRGLKNVGIGGLAALKSLRNPMVGMGLGMAGQFFSSSDNPTTSTVGSVLSGVGAGAMAGSMFGGWGTAIGAVIGGLTALSSASKEMAGKLADKKIGQAISDFTDNLENIPKNIGKKAYEEATVSALNQLSYEVQSATRNTGAGYEGYGEQNRGWFDEYWRRLNEPLNDSNNNDGRSRRRLMNRSQFRREGGYIDEGSESTTWTGMFGRQILGTDYDYEGAYGNAAGEASITGLQKERETLQKDTKRQEQLKALAHKYTYKQLEQRFGKEGAERIARDIKLLQFDPSRIPMAATTGHERTVDSEGRVSYRQVRISAGERAENFLTTGGKSVIDNMNKAFKEVNQQLQPFRDYIGDVNIALSNSAMHISRTIKEFATNVERSSFVIEGIFGTGIQPKVSDMALNALNNPMSGDFRTVLGSLGGTMGNADMMNKLGQMAYIKETLPNILAAAQSNLNNPDALDKVLEGTYRNTAPDLYRRVGQAIRATLSSGGGEGSVDKSLSGDPLKLTEAVMKDLGFDTALEQAGGAIKSKLEKAQIVATKHAESLMQERQVREQERFGGEIGFRSAESARQRAFARGELDTGVDMASAWAEELWNLGSVLPEAGGQFDVASMGVRGADINRRMSAHAQDTNLLLSNPEEYYRQQNLLVDESQRYMQVLQKLTQGTETYAAAQKRLSELVQQEQSSKDYTSRYLSADPGERIKMEIDFQQMVQNLSRGNFAGLDMYNQSKTWQTLQSLPQGMMLNYGGQQLTREQIINQGLSLGTPMTGAHDTYIRNQRATQEQVVGDLDTNRQEYNALIIDSMRNAMQTVRLNLTQEERDHQTRLANTISLSNTLFDQATTRFQQAVQQFVNAPQPVGGRNNRPIRGPGANNRRPTTTEDLPNNWSIG